MKRLFVDIETLAEEERQGFDEKNEDELVRSIDEAMYIGGKHGVRRVSKRWQRKRRA